MLPTRLLAGGVLVLVGCSDGGGSATPDAAISADAAIDAPAPCLTPAAGYGAVTAAMQAAFSDMSEGETTPDYYELDAQLDGEAAPDVMLIQLYKGFGTFTAGYPTTFPQTIELTGAEAQFATCGACILVLPDVDANGMPTGNPYLATGGSLTLTSITPMLAGSISNLTLTRVAIDAEDNSTADGGGCASSVTSMSFSAQPMPL